MNTKNETGVKVPKGQINYNTVAGSLGLAAFAGLGLRNWLGNGNGSVVAGATAVAETQLVSGLMAELAKEKSERYADNVGINTFKEALALIKEERETRQANDKIIFETLARLDKGSALNKQDIENFKKSLVSSVMFVTISKLLLLLKLNVENLLMNELLIMQIAISLNTSKRSMLRRFVRLLS